VEEEAVRDKLWSLLGLTNGLDSPEDDLRAAWEYLDCAAGQIQVELEQRPDEEEA
jgi:hypothetical protein